jgi:hypothetical protein
MNRIVKEHYPVENLPADLREGLDPQARVTITLVAEATGSPAQARATDEKVRTLLEARARLRSAPDDSVSRVSALRNDWDH